MRFLCNGFVRSQEAAVDQTGCWALIVIMTFFGAMRALRNASEPLNRTSPIAVENQFFVIRHNTFQKRIAFVEQQKRRAEIRRSDCWCLVKSCTYQVVLLFQFSSSDDQRLRGHGIALQQFCFWMFLGWYMILSSTQRSETPIADLIYSDNRELISHLGIPQTIYARYVQMWSPYPKRWWQFDSLSQHGDWDWTHKAERCFDGISAIY